MTDERLPPGWDKARIERVLAHYERQTDDQAVIEDEQAFTEPEHTVMEIPIDLVPKVRELLARRHAG